MVMCRLHRERYPQALSVYRSSEPFFPLVAAVLLDIQAGVVFTDHAERPTQFYVEHPFGFAQLFGEPNTRLEEALARYLLFEPRFHAPKVRLYGVYVPDFLKPNHPNSSVSTRQRFHPGTTYDTAGNLLSDFVHDSQVELVNANSGNLAEIEERFRVVERFWRTPDDFIHHAVASIALYRGQMAAICYSAATADQKAEIDVITLPKYRRLGLGKAAAAAFVQSCQRLKIEPLWDCFTNNLPSMELARTMGYLPFGKPYSFYTINR